MSIGDNLAKGLSNFFLGMFLIILLIGMGLGAGAYYLVKHPIHITITQD